MLLRHPSDYRLVALAGSDYEHPVSGHKHLMRIAPSAETPVGYQDVLSINGQAVSDNDLAHLPATRLAEIERRLFWSSEAPCYEVLR